MSKALRIRSTTILAVRRDGRVALGGDGQVSVGETVMKANAQKVRTLKGGKVLAGFAGSTADAFTLFERFEEKLERFPENLPRAAVELGDDLLRCEIREAGEGCLSSFRKHDRGGERGPRNEEID